MPSLAQLDTLAAPDHASVRHAREAFDATVRNPPTRLAWHVFDANAAHESDNLGSSALRLGVDLRARLPDVDPDLADLWITTAARASRPWVYVASTELQDVLARLHRRLEVSPIA